MTDENRLDRIEALIERIGQKVESNARAIEASRQEFLDLRKQWELDRSRLYQTMAESASSQANFYQAQASFYKRLQEVEERQERFEDQQNERQERFERQQNERQERFERQQGDIIEILKLLTQQNQQQN